MNNLNIVLLIIVYIETFIIIMSILGSAGIDNYAECYDDCMSIKNEYYNIEEYPKETTGIQKDILPQYQQKKNICNKKCAEVNYNEKRNE